MEVRRDRLCQKAGLVKSSPPLAQRSKRNIRYHGYGRGEKLLDAAVAERLDEQFAQGVGKFSYESVLEMKDELAQNRVGVVSVAHEPLNGFGSARGFFLLAHRKKTARADKRVKIKSVLIAQAVNAIARKYNIRNATPNGLFFHSG